MCVGVPAEVIEIEGIAAVVDVMGSRIKVGILFVPEVRAGDYVIVHAGQAISVIDRQAAEDSLEEWRKLIDARQSERPS
ncbi:HypC/HybG/HupF family hydrogenase formation chaperone [Gorillibacterium sp. sgz5001074]|uniref:HypC/HybG/HupF family hydrogenase formation chaperone n=1 Tax=Gorillibacterium sp. sgz5001074 TaxID=3446695 RepID=UPI003F666591